MEGNGNPADDPAQDRLKDKVAADTRLEHEFVNGYMDLMKCSETAARAVFMYSDLPSRQVTWGNHLSRQPREGKPSNGSPGS